MLKCEALKAIKDVDTISTSYVKFGYNLWTTYIGVNPEIIAFLYRAEFVTAGLHCCDYQ
jgi:hypothetical protein